MKCKRIFTKKVAYKLISKGNNLINMESNNKKKWLKIFVFEMNTKLLEDLTEITKK